MSTESLRARLEAVYSLSNVIGEGRRASRDDLIDHAPTDLAAALKVIEAAKEDHYHVRSAEYVSPGSNTVWDWVDKGRCMCGDDECAELAAVDAFEALP